MGLVLHDLVRIKLPDRELHNSRMFVDLCENIHIHYRELRIVFSLDEYFEFASILGISTEDARNYLAQNPDYEEGKYGTTVMIAGGPERQLKLLENSPRPNQSTYFANDFAIELQAASVIDEIHVHWRDYRVALSREHFHLIADAFNKGNSELLAFEQTHDYFREPHESRSIEDFSEERAKYKNCPAKTFDEVLVPIGSVKTRFRDIMEEFKPLPQTIDLLRRAFVEGERIAPILLSTEKNGDHIIIDGQHRFYAAKTLDQSHIRCVIVDITFDESDKFRKAEYLLKEFDRETHYRFNTSAFNREFIAHKLGRHYKDHFYKKLKEDKTHRTRAAIFKLRTGVVGIAKHFPCLYEFLKRIRRGFLR